MHKSRCSYYWRERTSAISHWNCTLDMAQRLWEISWISCQGCVIFPTISHQHSQRDMFCMLQMWTFALLSQTIVVESVSNGSKSLGHTWSSTFRTVVNADEDNSTNDDLVACFFLNRRFFLCLYFLYLILLMKDCSESRRCGQYLRYVGPRTKPSLYPTILDKKYITDNPNY